jgi:hypothetical protein
MVLLAGSGGGVLAMATSTSPVGARAASGNNCSAAAFTPDIQGPFRAPNPSDLSLSSKGRFRCGGRLSHANLKVVLQGRVNGRWTTLATLRKTLALSAGKTYTLRTRPLACRANAHQTSVRTHVELNGLRGTSPSRTVLCI